MAAVRRGVGREAAHEVIKEHAVAVALAMREGGADNDLLDRLAGDARLGVDRADLDAAVARPLELTGTAGAQVSAVLSRIEKLVAAHPDAAAYTPGLVL